MMRIFIFLLTLSFSLSINAQSKFKVREEKSAPIERSRVKLNPEALEQLQSSNYSPRALQHLQLSKQQGKQQLTLNSSAEKIIYHPKTGLPIFIKGNIQPKTVVQTRSNRIENQVYAFLHDFKPTLQIKQPEAEFVVSKQDTDAQGMTHTRMQQFFEGIPVYGTEVIAHSKDGVIKLFNGQYFATPSQLNTRAQKTPEAAIAIVKADLGSFTRLLAFNPHLETLTGEKQVSKQELTIFFSDPEGKQAHLAYEINIAANPLQKWTYIVDAQDGSILKKFNRVCSLHHDHAYDHPHAENIDWSQFKVPTTLSENTVMFDGPRTANALDLLGQTRLVNSFQIADTFYLLDASRAMWQGLTGESFNGGIYTADAQNTNTDNFDSRNVTSLNNTWGSRSAVSAHYNAGIAYEYFRTTFGRNSINGTGGNIVSFINVADDDGGGLDNAFWNGQFMFYGNGRQAFSPLAGALDVAGHEMSHGVIQNTANLEYQGESGSLNESFADIFGVMIDREDWLLGEDVVNRQVFRTGALRNMMDPNNGGRSLGDRGWQPANVSEQYFGQENNGGVHINSGIPNRAFYLFATQIGRDNAELVYYDALANYLTRSSQFIDARLAVIEAANQRFGANVAATAASAFDAVGITEGTPTAPPEEAPTNEGSQFLLMVGESFFGNEGQGVYLTQLDGTEIQGANPLTNDGVLFKPSISDDGSRILYINTNNQLRLIDFDWTNGTFNIIELSNERVWRRCAISKDGLKVALTTTDQTADIVVFDLRNPQNGQVFELSNPTTAESGLSFDDVQYADGLEWDLSSQFVIYDAFNEVDGLFGSTSYFDIGSIFVWDNNTDRFADGTIDKLYSSLPDNVSIGNPAISKNSPNIIVFDYIDNSPGEEQLFIAATDIETRATIGVAQPTVLGFPNYSVEDDFVIFEDGGGFLGGKEIKRVPLDTDKINPTAAPTTITSGFQWPNWFATGTRVITNVENRINPDRLSIETFP
ncbi:MAG: M4 family metallopeptidase, partial [Bacteroidota bacterium]